MSTFAHTLDSTIYAIQPVILAIALLILLLALISPLHSKQIFLACTLLVAGIGACEIAISMIIRAAALNEIRPVLSGDLEAISVSGKPSTQGADFVALRGMDDAMGHHSHPTSSYRGNLTRLDSADAKTRLRKCSRVLGLLPTVPFG